MSKLLLRKLIPRIKTCLLRSSSVLSASKGENRTLDFLNSDSYFKMYRRTMKVVPWSYWNEEFGPGNWSKYFPAGGGKKQSPLDIITSEARFDESLGNGNFQFNYHSQDCVSITNTGVSWQVACRPDAQSTLTATHLDGTFLLRQIHCHWGTEPMNGSEHLVGGVGYAGELHFVHWNTKYGAFEEALKQPDGLAVIGVFLNESHDDNPHLRPILTLLDKIMYKGDTVPIDRGFDFIRLVPDKTEFWTYEGSLTTPPLNECVVWTVFRASVPISSNQLDALRTLYAVSVEDVERDPQRIAGNIRPPQALNGRLVRASFRSGGVVDAS